MDVQKTARKYQEYFDGIQKLKPGFGRSIRVIRYFWMFGNSMLVDTYLLDILINISSAILGLFYSKFFFSFMLLDIIGRSDILKNVIRSVTKNFG